MQDTILDEIIESLKPLMEFHEFFLLPDGVLDTGYTLKVHKVKLASTNEDFELIYQREIKRTSYKEPGALEQWLSSYVAEMLAYEKSLPAKERKPFADLEVIADKFLKWIQSSTESNNNNIIVQKSYLIDSIEKWIYEFKVKMPESDYNTLITSLECYFKTGKFPVLNKTIQVRKVNKKVFGFALNNIYREACTKPLSREYLLFAKNNISLFKDVAIDTDNIRNSNLYKYFTQNIYTPTTKKH